MNYRTDDRELTADFLQLAQRVWPGQYGLIAVAGVAHSHKSIEALDHLEDSTVAEIEQFFVSYNTLAGKEFRPMGRGGPDRARELVEDGKRRYAEK